MYVFVLDDVHSHLPFIHQMNVDTTSSTSQPDDDDMHVWYHLPLLIRHKCTARDTRKFSRVK